MNEEQEKEILNEAKIQTARHKKKIQIISLVAIIAVIAMAIVACIPLIKALHSKAGIAALERKLDNYSGIVGVLIFTFIQALQVVIAVIPPVQVVGGVLFGCIGLIKAIDNFNLDMDVAFSTYAVPMITGEIRRFLRDDGMVKVSRSIKENAVKSMRAAGQLRDTLGCEPTVEQIAAACELSVEDITLSMSASMEVESIYKTIYQGDGSEVMLMDKLEDKADIGETASSKVALAQLMETLSQREKELIRMRYYDDYTQMQVAKEFGISQVQVSRMEKKILSGMRKRLFA